MPPERQCGNCANALFPGRRMPEIIDAGSFAWLYNYLDRFQKEREGMKRRSKLDFSRLRSARILFSSRTLFSLAVFSLSLVGFGAVAYAVSIPAVLADPFEVAPVSDSLFDPDSKKADASESSANVDSAAAFDGADINTTAGEGTTLGLSSLMGSPVFSSMQNILDNSSGAGSDSSTQNPAVPAPHPNDPSNDPSQSGGSSGSSSTSKGLSDEVEEEIHAHLLECYANLQPYYNEVCEGFENLYASMNPSDPSKTHVSCAPTNAQALLTKCDQGRIKVSSYRHNGEAVLSKSKWYGEAEKLSKCFNDLTNSCSVLRTVSGFLITSAPIQLAPHLNSNGEIRYLSECRERFATIKL